MRKALATPQAAAYTGLASSTLQKKRMTRTGPPFVKLGRRVVYFESDLDEWLTTHRRDCTNAEDKAA